MNDTTYYTGLKEARSIQSLRTSLSSLRNFSSLRELTPRTRPTLIGLLRSTSSRSYDHGILHFDQMPCYNRGFMLCNNALSRICFPNFQTSCTSSETGPSSSSIS